MDETPAQDGEEIAHAPTKAASAARRDGRPQVAWVGLAIGGILVVTLIVAVASIARLQSRSDELTFVIPAGTGQRMDAGEYVEVIPASLELQTGESVTVRNEDDRLHTVGPFSVRAHETLNHRFSRAGVYKGLCTVHGSGEVTITVW